MNIAPPSRNPTVDGKLRTVLRFVFNKLVQATLDDMIPAQVVAYNRTTNMASVQPMISMVTTLNQVIPRAVIASVPVSQLGGGGFTLNFPINPGDIGWLKANDRDISIWKQLWQIVAPNTGRMHSFEDGTFIPVALVNFVIAASDAGNVVLQSLTGAARISLGDGNACISDTAGYAQSVNCILDVQSTTRAFKFPTMSATQKNAIVSPISGMAVFDTTKPGLSVYTTGVGWS